MFRFLEKRLGRFAIPNITAYVILAQVAMYLMVHANPQFATKMLLIPKDVMAGEIFRLLTFVIVPPCDSPLWAFFFWYLFYLMGTALERFWGTFKYNLFLLVGYVATVATAFITPEVPASNWFLEGTVFLAFAWLNPDFVLHIFYVLAVRIKWLALLTWIGFGFIVAFGPWSALLGVVASVLNFLIFFGSDIRYRMTHGHRHMFGQVRRFSAAKPEYLHKCEACGITDTSHPQEDFRYCSKCTGDVAYCSEHLRDHAHLVDAFEE